SQRFGPHQRDGRNRALSRRHTELVMNHRVGELDLRRVFGRAAEIIALDPCPVDCRQTHWTWFAGRIELAAREMKRAERFCRVANRHNLRMCRRIVLRRHFIAAATNDAAVSYDHGSEWAAAPGSDAFQSHTNGFGHKSTWALWCVMNGSRHWPTRIYNLKSKICNPKFTASAQSATAQTRRPRTRAVRFWFSRRWRQKL